MIRRALRRVPGARPLARRLRSGWERVQPLPRPRYVPGTPRVGGREPLDLSIRPTAPTLGAAAMSIEATRFVVGVLDRLTPTKEFADERFFYLWAQGKYGAHWRYADLLTALCAAAYFLRPSSYLEIGVHRGRSAAVVAAMAPSCDIYGFDLWVPGYGGMENPGPEFVRSELQTIGHTGHLELISGDSRETLPRFLRQHPELRFDLITIDGAKSLPGAASDFSHALPRLKIGGIVVYDDLPVRPALRRVWEKAVLRDRRYVTWEFDDGKYGVAAAIRIADTPS